METTMDYSKTLSALRKLKVNTGSLACFGCGMEHNCGIHGCAIVRNAVEHMEAALSNVETLETALDAAEEEIRDLHSDFSSMERSRDEAYSATCKERDELKTTLDGAMLSMKALNERLVAQDAELQKVIGELHEVKSERDALISGAGSKRSEKGGQAVRRENDERMELFVI